MHLSHGLHLAYCTNIHRGETWPETFAALQQHTLAVRDRVCPTKPYAIGLRLSNEASEELVRPEALKNFRAWLEKENCYVFTINGFPYGKFHGTRVKEQVYAPDWTTEERVQFTNRLFSILAEVLPTGIAGSVSTVPCSFKEFITTRDQVAAMRRNLWRCVEHIHDVSQRTGRDLHLGLEPEPLCYLETTDEACNLFEQMRADRPNDDRIAGHLGINYDTCHLAVEYEEARPALEKLNSAGIRISKIHVSSALRVKPTTETRKALQAFADDTYFHQVIERNVSGKLRRYRDLDVALSAPEADAVEWRIHFHIPLHAQATRLFQNTTDHIDGVFDVLKRNPGLCSHLEMETYTWEVMPAEMKNRSVVDQLVAEYHWTLDQLRQRGFEPL